MQNVLITGASSGIGKSLALHFAKQLACKSDNSSSSTSTPVTHHLVLTGRNLKALQSVQREISTLHISQLEVVIKNIDVTDKEGMEQFIRGLNLSFHCVICNAGISSATLGSQSFDIVEKIFSVNVMGVFNTIIPSLELMKENRRGRVVIISSLVGFHPGMSEYSLSKNTIINYGKLLSRNLAPYGITVDVICPGWVATNMSRQFFKSNQPEIPQGMMTADTAAEIIWKRIKRDRTSFFDSILYGFPSNYYWGAYLTSLLPDCLKEIIYSKVFSDRRD